MIPLIQADWEAVTALAAISLAEGMRKVPQGAVVFRALGLSEWLVVDGNRKETGWRLISWWPPFTRHLVQPPRAPGVPVPARVELEARFATAQRHMPVLDTLCALEIVALVLGVPVGAATFGGNGFLLMLGAVVVAVVLCVLAAMRALLALGYSTGDAWLRARSLVSPFGASQAGERVLEAVFEGASPVQVGQLLMSADAFNQWIRPAVYDVRNGEADLLGVGELLEESERERALETEAFEGGSVCPRCGRAYRAGVEVCADCGGVALEGVGSRR